MQASVSATRMQVRSRLQFWYEKLTSPPSQKAAVMVRMSTLGRKSELRSVRRGARVNVLASDSIAMAHPVLPVSRQRQLRFSRHTISTRHRQARGGTDPRDRSDGGERRIF